MTIGTAYITFGDFPEQLFYGRYDSERVIGDGKALGALNMVELQHDWVGLTTIDTRMVSQVLIQKPLNVSSPYHFVSRFPLNLLCSVSAIVNCYCLSLANPAPPLKPIRK